jgi:hypothetical protein
LGHKVRFTKLVSQPEGAPQNSTVDAVPTQSSGIPNHCNAVWVEPQQSLVTLDESADQVASSSAVQQVGMFFGRHSNIGNFPGDVLKKTILKIQMLTQLGPKINAANCNLAPAQEVGQWKRAGSLAMVVRHAS